ncbi:hypothetical protein RHOFW104T7_10925 [Rhodanobacter thiooxydans]|uniref:Uncharacterized protein n=2 Tax=Rhodanobacter thiooxydans TaxID=416169 RepID=A0A154QJW9_9GAMM|nr:hypothetical protein RHOFW104T7_10925 [Rhodanobacter thiooxydans]
MVDDPLRALRELNPEARSMPEGNLGLVFLPAQTFEVAGQRQTADLLLCPAELGGYQTRLFFDRPFPQRAANWTVHTLLGRSWHTFSWNGVQANQPLEQILLAHLAVLR